MSDLAPVHQLIEAWPVPPLNENARFLFTWRKDSEFELGGYFVWQLVGADGKPAYAVIRKFFFQEEAWQAWKLLKRGVPIETVKEICFTE